MAENRKKSAFTPAQKAEIAEMIEEAFTLTDEDKAYLDRETAKMVKRVSKELGNADASTD